MSILSRAFKIGKKDKVRPATSPAMEMIDPTFDKDFIGAIDDIIRSKQMRRRSWAEANSYVFFNGTYMMIHKDNGKDYQWVIGKDDINGNDWIVAD